MSTLFVMRSIPCRSTRDILLAAAAFSLLSLYITYRLGPPLDGATVALTSHTAGTNKLLNKLLQLEKKNDEAMQNVVKIALVKGQKGIVERDLPIYRKALLKYGFRVYPTHEANGSQHDDDDDWLLLLCMSFTDGDNCLERASYSRLKPQQKINRIYGIRNTLWRKDGFCTTMTNARQLTAVRRSHLTPLCFVLPNQLERFIHVADALGGDAQWLLKPLIPGGNVEFIENFENYGKQRLRKQSANQVVLIQQYFPRPFLVFGSPVSLRIYILVTSISPLRVFLFNEGIVHFRQNASKGFKKIANRTWLLSQLWHYVARSYGERAVRLALVNIRNLVVETLLVAESTILGSAPSSDKKWRCRHCFQMLGFDLILNSSFHPVLLEVNGQPNLQQSWRDDGWKKGLVESMLGLLFTTTKVANRVSEAMRQCADNVGVMGLNCRITDDLCLSEDDLNLLMDSRREAVNRGSFKQLYPTLEADKYTPLINDLEYLMALPKTYLGVSFRETFAHNTADMHNFLTSLEKCYNRQTTDDEYNLNEQENDFWNNLNENLTSKFVTQDLQFRPPCSEDPVTMPYLLNIFSQPKLNLTPDFSPLIVEFAAKVPYDQLMVTVWAFAHNCQSEARLDDKFGPSQSANYTLGLGDNRITFVIVDIRHTEPWVINTYSIVVHRQSNMENEPEFDVTRNHQVCSLKQDCDLRLVANDPCGLGKDDSIENWSNFDQISSNLPICDRGDAIGRWLLPCITCTDTNSCFWRQAVWAPLKCRHPYVTRHVLARCLTGKKLLFIGDSTNRGIMHYVMERLNGTLAEWDKTHHIRIHANLNGGKTAIGFAYYPQFWLPTDERPVFDKALYQLLERSRPLQNNSNTILIVGGVHWLATQHLHMLLQGLRKDGLQGIKLIVKTLGSGFHLPVNGVHCLTRVEQRKLLLHSRGLSEFAKRYNFDVIDTFNITIPRFRDFLQGKCACHFHKVVPLSDNTYGNGEYRYHVEGPVNAVYSEILISRLCSDYVVQDRDVF